MSDVTNKPVNRPTSKSVGETVGRLLASEPAALADPYPLYATLREAGACHWVADDWGQGSWHVTRYAEVAPALKDLRLSSQGVIRPPELQAEKDDDLTRLFWQTTEGSLLTADPPDHTRLRKLVSPGFTPKRIEALRPQLQAVVDDLLGAAEAKGEVDFIADFASPLPLVAIATLMGVPREDWALFRRLSDGLFDFQPSRQTMLKVKELVSYLQDLAQMRRAQPRDDLISALVQARGDTDALTNDELIAQLFVLLTSGIDTTSAGLGNSLLTLLRRPKTWDAFGAGSVDQATVNQAVEELLRFESPFQYAIRRASEDLELGGQRVQAGEFVWLWLGSANRDPAVFTRPDDLDLSRKSNRHTAHLAFGLGIHYCLGAPLARLELQLALATLRERYPKLHLTRDEVSWRSGSFVRSLETLPITFF